MRSLRQNQPVLRIAFVAAGCLLLVGAVVVTPLPGPAGIFLTAGALALILPNSVWAMRRFAGLKRRWPRLEGLIDRVMRRPSALRRAAIAKERAAG